MTVVPIWVSLSQVGPERPKQKPPTPAEPLFSSKKITRLQYYTSNSLSGLPEPGFYPQTVAVMKPDLESGAVFAAESAPLLSLVYIFAVIKL